MTLLLRTTFAEIVQLTSFTHLLTEKFLRALVQRKSTLFSLTNYFSFLASPECTLKNLLFSIFEESKIPLLIPHIEGVSHYTGGTCIALGVDSTQMLP